MQSKLGVACLALGLVLSAASVPACSRVIGLGGEYYVVEAGGTSGVAPSNGGDGSGGEIAAGGGGGTGGTGGTGGRGGGSGANSGGDAGASPIAMLCEMYPIPPRTTWVPSASSHGPNDPVTDLTDNTAARWSTGKPQAGDEWLQIDFGMTVGIRSVNLQQGSDPNDYPRKYSVTISDTKNDLTGPALYDADGSPGVSTTTILSQPHAGRYLLIKQLGTSLSWWSVDEIEVGCIDD